MLSLPRAGVQSLVGQLRSHKLHARSSKRETKMPSKLIHKITLHKGLILCETNLWWLRYGSQWIFFLPFPAPACSHSHGLPGKHLLHWAVVHVLQCGAWFDVSSPSSHFCLPRIAPPSKVSPHKFCLRLHFPEAYIFLSTSKPLSKLITATCLLYETHSLTLYLAQILRNSYCNASVDSFWPVRDLL